MRQSFFSSTVSTIATFATLLIAFVTPVVFFPFVPGVFETGKYAFVIFAALALVITYAVVSIFHRSIEVSRSLWTIGFAVLGISTVVSIFLSSPNKIAALTGVGMFWIGLALIYIVLSTLIQKQFTVLLTFALGAAGVVITLFSVLEKVGVNFFSMFGLSGTPVAGIFPNGGSLVNAAVLLTVLVLMITTALVQKTVVVKLISIAVAGLVTLGLIVNVVSILPGQPQAPVLLSFSDSWSVALDILKTPRTALVGVGPEQYANAFALYKPGNLNSTPYWFVRFGTAHNLPLDIIVTHGLLGLSALVLITVGLLSRVRKTYKEDLPLVVASVVMILTFLVIPASPVLLVILTLLLVAWHASTLVSKVPGMEEAGTFVLISAHNKGTKDERNVATGLVAGIGVVLAALAVYGLFINVTSVAAYMTYNRALKALRDNKAKETYDLTRQAIAMTPYREEMRRTFSQINMTIALGLTQQKDLSDADRKTALTLVQQSINEAKAATALNQTDATNWENLALIYNTLIGSATGADQWTIAGYTQAIIRDPANPKLRFDLGAVYRKLKNDDSAQRLFEQAAQLKGDYANAYFNLADIAKGANKPDQEYVYLQRTLQLIKTSDPQYQVVKDRSDALAKQLGDKAKAAQDAAASQQQTQQRPQQSASPSATLRPISTPKPATSSAKIELPPDAGIASGSAVPDVPKPTPTPTPAP